jgi:hypothetical protein
MSRRPPAGQFLSDRRAIDFQSDRRAVDVQDTGDVYPEEA